MNTNQQHLWKVLFGNGQMVNMSGGTFSEAYLKTTGMKTKTGEIDFSLLENFMLLDVISNAEVAPKFHYDFPVDENEPRYQLFVVDEKGKEAKKDGHPTNNLDTLQKLLERKVKFEKKISAWIIDLYRDKVISWLY